MKWYKLRASGLQYTVMKKEFRDGEYHCIIRFRNTVLPHPDWVRLTALRAHAELIIEESKPTNVPVPFGFYWI